MMHFKMIGVPCSLLRFEMHSISIFSDAFCLDRILMRANTLHVPLFRLCAIVFVKSEVSLFFFCYCLCDSTIANGPYL